LSIAGGNALVQFRDKIIFRNNLWFKNLTDQAPNLADFDSPIFHGNTLYCWCLLLKERVGSF